MKRSLIRGFPHARLADIINQTRPTGPGNRRTMQFSYKSGLSLSMTLKTEEDIFFVDHVFCIFKKELMKYVVLEYVHVSPLHYNYFVFMSSFGFRPNSSLGVVNVYYPFHGQS
jgi:hypothetical protein